MAGAREVGGAVEAAVADGAAEAGVGVGRGVAHEQVDPRVGAEGLLPVRAVEPRAVGRHVAGHAAVDAVDVGEVDVLVEPRQDHLLDLEARLDEVHHRRVEDEVVDALVQVGDARLDAVDAALQGLELLLRIGQHRLLGGQPGLGVKEAVLSDAEKKLKALQSGVDGIETRIA
ncbi:MAG: hypothetical protein JF614_31360, partial [Acidobacteria bacterium]|nr:hypothetical protein [Acidobacteriota bacterium]